MEGPAAGFDPLTHQSHLKVLARLIGDAHNILPRPFFLVFMRHLCARSRLVYIFIYPADRISLSFFFSPSLFLDRGRLALWNLWMPRPRLAPQGDPRGMKMPSCAAVFQLQIQKLTNLIYCLRLIRSTIITVENIVVK